MSARVLCVTQAAELGGAEYALLRIARRLPGRGFEIEATAPGRGATEEAFRAAGFPVHRLAVGPLRAGGWPRALLELPRGRALARRTQPDIVYLNGTVAQRLAPALAGRTLVPHLHDLLEAVPRPWRSRRFWDSVPVVLCASGAVAERAEELGAPPERLRTVFCPIEPAEPAPRPDWRNGEGPVVGFVGRVEPRKGVLDLLRAAPVLLERRPDARIVIVGDDELGASRGYRDEARALASGIGERVLLTGAVPEANRLMAWFDVLAVPSLVEPFGTVAAEALAAGTPVVATRSGGMAEYVVEGRNGALVDPGDPPGLAGALDRVLADAEALGATGREDAARFASDRVASAVADALGEAL
ncbi:MAG: glycosyltransferase family 4 protein [Thermoleophilaceae bacterium]